MPSGLAGLTSLNRLPRFILNCYEDELKYKPKSTAKLCDLKDLNNLRGDLHIEIYKDFGKNTVEAMEANLTCKQGITKLDINFKAGSDPDDSFNHHERVLQGLKLHSNLRKLRIEGYYGQKFPIWTRIDNFCITLPNLVVIQLIHCTFCKQVPIFSQLPFLKHLSIMTMDNVEYMEDGVCDISSSSKAQGMRRFFPSLEELVLFNMYNLKGWWKGVEATVNKNDSESTLSSELAGTGQQCDNNQLSMQFCNLSSLTIEMCPNLISLPLCPKVEFLRLSHNNDRLSVLKMVTTVSTATTSSSSSGEKGLELKELQMNNVEVQLTPLPKQCLNHLSSLYIFDDEKLVSTKSLEVFTALSFSLQSLEFRNCKNLSSISEGLQHLTALKNLSVNSCEELDLSPASEDGRNMMPWKALKANLRSLELYELPKLYSLPSGLQHLKNLRSLRIIAMYELNEIPEWISCLSSLEELFLSSCLKLTSLPEAVRSLNSLKYLNIRGTPGLSEKWQRPDGSDCPKFQHVPLVIVEG